MEPLIRIIGGDPTEDELAALMAVLITRAGAGHAAARPRIAARHPHPRARWRLPRDTNGYRSPASWR